VRAAVRTLLLLSAWHEGAQEPRYPQCVLAALPLDVVFLLCEELGALS